MAEDTTYDLIAATGCPTGIAHTYMAKEALEKAAAAKKAEEEKKEAANK